MLEGVKAALCKASLHRFRHFNFYDDEEKDRRECRWCKLTQQLQVVSGPSGGPIQAWVKV